MTFTLVAQLLAIAAASGTRSSLAIFALALGGRFLDVSLPGELEFLSTNLGLGLLVGLVVLDEMVERDPDLQELLVTVNIGIRGSAGAVAAWGLGEAVGSDVPEVAVLGLGAVVAIAVHLLRARFAQYLPEGDGWLDPRSWLAWLEAGGVVGIVAAVFLAPFLALAIVVAFSVAGTVAMVAGRAIERARHRRACPSCGHFVRLEASLCPSCSATLDVERRLQS